MDNNDNISVEDLKAMFRDIAERFKETEKRFQETDKKFKETDKKFQETDKKFQETREMFKETDKRIDKEHGFFTTQWGKLIEAIVKPASLKLFTDKGIDVSRIYENTKVKIKGEVKAEYDIILANGSEVVVVEVKSTLRVEDVKYFVNKMSDFKTYMPDYTNKKVYGAMAAINFSTESANFAMKNRLFFLKSSGEGILTLGNKEDFVPRSF